MATYQNMQRLATAEAAGAMSPAQFRESVRVPTTAIAAGAGVTVLATVAIAELENVAITARLWGSDGLSRQCDCVLEGTFARFVGDPTIRNYAKGTPYRLDVADWRPALAIVGNTVVLQIVGDVDDALTVSADITIVRRSSATVAAPGKDSGVWVPVGTILEPATAAETTWIQEPNLLYDTDPQILVGETNVFKLWFSHGLSAGLKIGYAESVDCVHWTKHPGNPILSGYTRCGGVSRAGGYYYLSAVAGNGTLYFMRSANGIGSWTVVGSIPKGNATAWDSQINNSCAWYESGTTWHIMYDGVDGVSGWYVVGGATSTDGGATWTKWTGNPVITVPTAGPDINGTVGGPFVKKVGSTYYCWLQASPAGSYAPTDIVRFQATAPEGPWTQSFAPFALPRFRPANRTQTAGIYSQVADVTMCEANGRVYMVYSGLLDANYDSHFELAVAPMTLAELVETTEGICSETPPDMLINDGFEGTATPGYTTCFGWDDSVTDGAIARTVVAGEVHTDSSRIAAIKLTAGTLATTRISQTIKGLLGGSAVLRGWSRGDGTNGGRVRVRDSAGKDLIPWPTVLEKSTTYSTFMFQFTPPVDGVAILSCYCPPTAGGIAYFDDLSVQAISGSALDLVQPSEYASCVLSLGADGPMTVDGDGKISLWQDESGSDNHMIQASGAAQPLLVTIDRAKYVSFDGIAQYMATVAGATLKPHTLYVLGQVTAVHARYDGIVVWGSETGTAKSSAVGIASDNYYYGVGGYGAPVGAVKALNKDVVLAKVWDGTNSSGYRNAAFEASAANPLTSCNGVILLGVNAAPAGGAFAAFRVRAVACFAAAHDAATIAKITQYLRNRYSVLT